MINKPAFKQPCWHCANCSPFKCCFVKSLKLPKGCEIGDKGFITHCPNFVQENKLFDDEYLKVSLTELVKAVKNYCKYLKSNTINNNIPFKQLFEDVLSYMVEKQTVRQRRNFIKKYLQFIPHIPPITNNPSATAELDK